VFASRFDCLDRSNDPTHTAAKPQVRIHPVPSRPTYSRRLKGRKAHKARRFESVPLEGSSRVEQQVDVRPEGGDQSVWTLAGLVRIERRRQ